MEQTLDGENVASARTRRWSRISVGALAALMLLWAVMAAGCGGGATTAGNLNVFQPALLAASDVQTIIAMAVTRAAHDGAPVVVAISDREGNLSGVFDMTGAPSASPDGDLVNAPGGNTTQLIAIEKARTAAFLSSNQNAFSTRTGAFITQAHFPPGVANQPPGPLFGLPFSQLPCGDVQKHGNGITGAFGGIPIYLDGVFAGGIGVDGAASNEDEVIALGGVLGRYAPPMAITADNIFLGGIQLAWIGVTPPAPLPVPPFGSLPGIVDPAYPIIPTPTPPAEVVFDGVTGEWRFSPCDSPLAGAVKLTKSDVETIVARSLDRAIITRAAIRSPIGVPARMQVGVTDPAGNILGLFRTNDATMFSLDIVIQKGRSVVSFSDPTQPLGLQIRGMLGSPLTEPIAFTTRTLGFLAQPFYPPGIDGTAPGPLFQIQEQLYRQPPGPPNCGPQGDGITLFPGSVPLYKGVVMVGGLGISGDGVDQDDFVAAAGTAGFTPDPVITADNITFRGTPLPYLKFPRQPTIF